MDAGDTFHGLSFATLSKSADYYTMLGGLPVLRELGSADEALAAYIMVNSPLNAPEIGRITAANAYMVQSKAA